MPVREFKGALDAVPVAQEFTGYTDEEKKPALTAGDLGRGALTGYIADTAKGLGWGLEKLGVDYGRRMREAGDWFENEMTSGMSPQARAAQEQGVFTGEGIRDLGISDTWGKSLLLGAARSAPQMVQMVIPGAGVSGALSKIPALEKAAAAVEAATAAGTKAPLLTRMTAAIPSAIGYGGAEGLQAGATNAADTTSSIEQIPFAKLEQLSPRYRELLAATDPLLAPEQRATLARQQLAAEAGNQVFTQTAPWTAAAGIATGGGAAGLADRIMRGQGRGFLRSTGEGILTEALQEFPQSGGEAYIQNRANRDFVDPSIDPWKGVAAESLTGAAVGGFTGGVFGGGGAIMGRREPDRQPTDPRIPESHTDILNRVAADVVRKQKAEQARQAQPETPPTATAVTNTPKEATDELSVLRSSMGTLKQRNYLTDRQKAALVNAGYAERNESGGITDTQAGRDRLAQLEAEEAAKLKQAPAAEVEPSGEVSAMTDAELDLARRLTRSEERRAQIDAETAKRAHAAQPAGETETPSGENIPLSELAQQQPTEQPAAQTPADAEARHRNNASMASYQFDAKEKAEFADLADAFAGQPKEKVQKQLVRARYSSKIGTVELHQVAQSISEAGEIVADQVRKNLGSIQQQETPDDRTQQPPAADEAGIGTQQTPAAETGKTNETGEAVSPQYQIPTDQGTHFAAGAQARVDGAVRALPSYFKKPDGKNAKDWLRGWDDAHTAITGKPLRETVTPAEDTSIGVNDAGEPLYQRKDGSIYRMRSDRPDRPNGYPDFGGDLAPVEKAQGGESQFTSPDTVVSQGTGNGATVRRLQAPNGETMYAVVTKTRFGGSHAYYATEAEATAAAALVGKRAIKSPGPSGAFGVEDQGERVQSEGNGEVSGLDVAVQRVVDRRATDSIASAEEALQRQEDGTLKQIPERAGFCFKLSAEASAAGLGDMLIGETSDGEGGRIWHAVVMRDGAIYDPTFGQWFEPGVYEALGFTSEKSLTPAEVRAYIEESGGYAPDSRNQGIAQKKAAQPKPTVSTPTETATEKPAEQPAGFDSEAFNKERDDRIQASRDSGNVHLDTLSPDVETMRGKRIFYVHDPKVTGTIRTVDNNGNVYVDWTDAYSAEKEMASEVQDGKKTVMRSSLGKTDLKDYAVVKRLLPKDRRAIKAAKDQADKEQEAAAQQASAPEPIAGSEWWDALNEQQRLDAAVKAGWSTTKNTPNFVAKKLAKQAWAEIPAMSRETLLRKAFTEPQQQAAPAADEASKDTRPPIGELDMIRDGDIVEDTEGRQYIKMGKRQDWMELAPVVDGKPQVNASSTFKVAIADTARERNPQWRGDPFYATGQNYYDNVAKERDTEEPKAADKQQEPAKEKKPRAKAAESENRITDSGENLWYNRRNFTGKSLAWDDVKNLNNTLKIKEVTKAKVWPRPDYEKLVAEGLQPLFARLIKQVYDGIATTPSGTSDESLQRYITAVTKVRDAVFEWAKDNNANRAFMQAAAEQAQARLRKGPVSMISLLENNKSMQAAILERAWPESKEKGNRLFWDGEPKLEIRELGGKRAAKAMQFSVDDVVAAMKDLETGWPKGQEAWQKQGFKVAPSSQATVTEGGYYEDGKKVVRWYLNTAEGWKSRQISDFATKTEAEEAKAALQPFMLLDKGNRLVGLFDTEEQAKEAAREKTKRGAKGGKDLRGMNIAEAERKGPARRAPDENISSDRLKETFGFRGVNFGREGWINQAQRQVYLNHAYDGLMDLAEILNVPPKALSLDGILGIAFGAQGRGGAAAAHFVPGVNEINLTKTMGAGTLAHEWGHALDHYFGTQAAIEKTSEPYMSAHTLTVQLDGTRAGYKKGELAFQGAIRPEIAGLFGEIARAMDSRPETPEEAAQNKAKYEASSLRSLNRWIDHFRADIERTATDKEATLAKFDALAERLRNGDMGDGYIKVGQMQLPQVVGEIRILVRESTKNSSVNLPDNWKGLTSSASSVRYQKSAEYAERTHEPQRTSTDYKRESYATDKEKGGKQYWSTPWEMFARSFETYVADQLAERDQENTFLSDAAIRAEMRNQEGTGYAMPYPRNDDRTRINEAIGKLVAELKSRDTERGVAIYSDAVAAVPEEQWLSEAAIADVIEETVGELSAPIPIRIIGRESDVVANATAEDGAVSGFVLNGTIHLVREGLADRAAVVRTLWHELLHYGLRRFLTEDQYISALGDLYSRDGWIRERADQWMNGTDAEALRNEGKSDAYIRARGVDEALADLAEINEGKYRNDGILARAYRTVARWIASLAETFGFSEAAARWRGVSNDEARSLIRQVFSGLRNEAAMDTDSSGPAFMRAADQEIPSQEFKDAERAYGGREAYDKARTAGRTKLNYRQWVEVRTPSFKAWFGDWQALRVQQRLDAMEPVEVAIPSEWENLSKSELRQKVADALDSAVRNKQKIMHPELGDIQIGRKGERKTIHSSPDPAKLLIVNAIDRVIPASIVGEILPGDRQGIDARENLVTRVRVGGVELVAVISLNRQEDGRWYYNTVVVADSEKDNGPAARVKAPPVAVASYLGEAPLTRAVADFIRRPFERVNPDSVSSVVDENGEPLVVYHGTGGDFSAFSADFLYSGEGASQSGSGFYFTTNAESASNYATLAFGRKKPGNVMPVYLAIKNPLEIDFETGEVSGADISLTAAQVRKIILSRPNIRSTEDSPLLNFGDIAYEGFDKVLRDAASMYVGGNNIAALRNDFFEGDHDAWLNALSEATGHDGARSVTRNGDVHWVAWRPEQIKSSVGNRGTFDRNNPDITYMRGSGAKSADGRTVEQVKARVAELTRGWTNSPKFVITATSSEWGIDAPKDAYGAHKDGTVYIASSRIASEELLRSVLNHETTHAGVWMMGADAKPALMHIWAVNPKIRAATARWISANADVIAKQRMTDQQAKIRGIDEALAGMAQRGEKINGLQRLMAMVQKWMRSRGWHNVADWLETLSDAEALSLLAEARSYVENRDPDAIQVYRETAPAYATPAPIFYSELLSKVSELKQASGTPEQWQGIIRNLKGVKADEIEWSGIMDWLAMQSGKVAREQIADYLTKNGVLVEEVELGAQSFDSAISKAEEAGDAEAVTLFSRAKYMAERLGRGTTLSNSTINLLNGARQPTERDLPAGDTGEFLPFESVDRARQYIGAYGEPKFGQYQLGGGDNYRELLLTLPARMPDGWNIVERDGKFALLNKSGEQLTARPTREGIEEIAAKYANDPNMGGSNFRSSHFDQPNILAHIRFNERTDTDGKRVLFIEEIQSDWGQSGKRKGFTTPRTMRQILDERNALVTQRNKLLEEAAALPDAEMAKFKRLMSESNVLRSQIEALDAEHDEMSKNGPGVPNAPFVTKTDAWVSLALKRAIRYAAENGFDRVAWTNGEQQAARYDLSKHIDEIEWQTNRDGTIDVVANKGRSEVWSHGAATLDVIEESLGKEIAGKIAEGGRAGVLSGLDLKVGGDGMKSFYDRIVPKVANELLKKLGGSKVQTFDVSLEKGNFRDEDTGEEFPTGGYEEISPQPGFDITPALRERAMGGLPMFMRESDRADAVSETTADGAPSNDIGATVRAAYAGYPKGDVPRVQTARTLNRLLRQLENGEITSEYFESEVRYLTERLADVAATKEANRMVRTRERGADMVREKLIRARRQGDMSTEEVDFALWMLDQNPAMANDLGISIRQRPEGSNATGDYNPATRIMRLFKGESDTGTAVHEVLHHTERMMPPEEQKGIREEWMRAYTAALKRATPEQRAALERILPAMVGDVKAQQDVVQSIINGPLNYSEHYQLTNPSEYWAVNATRIMARRYGSNSWVAKARTWLSEMMQKVRGLLRMRSDAPILRGLQSVLDGDGTKKSGQLVDRNRFENIAALSEGARQQVGDLLQSDRTFNRWWHRTVGTQFHKASISEHFRRVFNIGQVYLTDTSRYAMMAEAEAPTLLLRMESVKDILKTRIPKADAEKIALPIFQGTLTDKKVYTDDELRGQFGLTDKQIGLYREFRASVDKSLDELAKSTLSKMARAVGVDRGIVDGLRDDDFPQVHAGLLQAMRDKLAEQRNLRRQATGIAREGYAQRIQNIEEQLQASQDMFDRIGELKQEGYAPLMRFGEYTVSVYTEDGEVIYFGMYESQAAANRAKRVLREVYADDPRNVTVKGSPLSLEASKVFQGVSPDTLEIFAKHLGLDQNPVFQTYLRLAVNNKSAMKRLMERKGTPGFSQDVTRVLAAFITSNARLTSSNYHMGDLQRAVDEIPQDKGDVKDEAENLRRYLIDPKEEAGALRGFLFFNFLGGSIAAAAVNMTQPITMTTPYLTQFTDAATVGKEMLRASKDAAIGKAPKDMEQAFQRATDEGIIAPHEIYQLMAEAEGGANRAVWLHRAMRAWGSFFALSEALNRRMTFIAAHRIGLKNGMTVAEAYDFAKNSVVETQGIYNRGNRPNWARGAVGATVFTFRQFSIAYLEFLKRLPPKQRALALAILFLAAGIEGLPFGEDLEDLIDTVGQWMGYSTNSKKWLRQNALSVLGEGAGAFVTRGVSSVIPIDVQGRLGVGNLIPGTEALKSSKTSTGSDALQMLGPVGGLIQNAGRSIEALEGGQYYQAVRNFAPVALANAMRGVEMWEKGIYTDTRGRKVMDVDGYDAFAKFIGFQPSDVAREQAKVGQNMQDINLAKNTETEIVRLWARGVVDNDLDVIQRARERLQEWNAKNPSAPIRILPVQIRKQVAEMRKSRDERLIKTAPREMRQGVARDLE